MRNIEVIVRNGEEGIVVESRVAVVARGTCKVALGLRVRRSHAGHKEGREFEGTVDGKVSKRTG